jgi:hypothetical protein
MSAEIPEGVAPAPVDGAVDQSAPSQARVGVDPALSRPDVIAAPSSSLLVTLAKDAETVPSLSAEQQSTAPWLDALRRRVEAAEASLPDVSSDNALARLAKRLEKGQSQDRGDDKAKGRDDPGPEAGDPDM